MEPFPLNLNHSFRQIHSAKRGNFLFLLICFFPVTCFGWCFSCRAVQCVVCCHPHCQGGLSLSLGCWIVVRRQLNTANCKLHIWSVPGVCRNREMGWCCHRGWRRRNMRQGTADCQRIALIASYRSQVVQELKKNGLMV